MFIINKEISSVNSTSLHVHHLKPKVIEVFLGNYGADESDGIRIHGLFQHGGILDYKGCTFRKICHQLEKLKPHINFRYSQTLEYIHTHYKDWPHQFHWKYIRKGFNNSQYKLVEYLQLEPIVDMTQYHLSAAACLSSNVVPVTMDQSVGLHSYKIETVFP